MGSKNSGQFKSEPWPAEEEARLRELVKKHNMREVARFMGRGYESVRHQVKRLELTVAKSHEMSFAELSNATKFAERNGKEKAATHYGVTVKAIERYMRAYRAQVAEFSRAITSEDVRRIKGIAHKIAVQRGKLDLAGDFASFCLLAHMTRSASKLNFENLWIDFMQDTFGDMKTGDGAARALATHTMSHITESSDPEDGVQVAAPSDRKTSAVLGLARALKLDRENTILWMLVHQEGYELTHIAPWFGMSTAGLCQRLKKMLAAARALQVRGKLADFGES